MLSQTPYNTKPKCYPRPLITPNQNVITDPYNTKPKCYHRPLITPNQNVITDPL